MFAKFWSTIFIAFFFLMAANISFAAPQEISAEGEYRLGDRDSRETAKMAALADAKRKIIEQVGVYVESYSEVNKFQLTQDQIRTAANAMIKLKSEEINFYENGTLCKAFVVAVVDTGDENIKRFIETVKDDGGNIEENNSESEKHTTSVKSIALPENGIYSLQPRSSPGYELIAENESKDPGANVMIWTINSQQADSKNHRWKIERLGNSNYYKITAENSKLALDVEGGVAEPGTNICVWSYEGGGNQQFLFWYENGYYTIQANLSGNYVLDVDHGYSHNGCNVLLWPSHGGVNQQWKLVKLKR